MQLPVTQHTTGAPPCCTWHDTREPRLNQTKSCLVLLIFSSSASSRVSTAQKVPTLLPPAWPRMRTPLSLAQHPTHECQSAGAMDSLIAQRANAPSAKRSILNSRTPRPNTLGSSCTLLSCTLHGGRKQGLTPHAPLLRPRRSGRHAARKCLPWAPRTVRVPWPSHAP